MRTLLIVDDEPNIVEGLASQFQERYGDGVIVLKSFSGLHALSVLQNNKVDVVLSDISMPDLDGIALAEKTEKLWPHIHFVFLSGFDDFDYIHRASKSPVYCGYLLKTEGDEVVLGKIDSELARCEAETRAEAQQNRMRAFMRRTALESTLRGGRSWQDFVAQMPDLFFHFILHRFKILDPQNTGVMFQQFDGEETRRNMLVAFDVQSVDFSGNRIDGVINVRAVSQHRYAVILQFVQRARQLLQQRPDAVRVLADGLDYGRTEIGFQLRNIVFQTLPAGVVRHVERQQHGDVKLRQLSGQIQTALRNCGVHHIDDEVNPRSGQFTEHDIFFGRRRGQGINAGQVNQFNGLAVENEGAGLAFHGNAGIVADMLSGAGQGVEDTGFSAVGISGQHDFEMVGHFSFNPFF